VETGQLQGERQWDAAPGPSTLAANSVSLLRKLVESGHGVALLPQHMASDSVRSGRLERVLPKESTPVWPVYAVTVGRQLPERVHLLLTHVRSVLQTQIAHSSARGKPASKLGANMY
jgi:DNA-binding transcriptional LysR family regulator